MIITNISLPPVSLYKPLNVIYAEFCQKTNPKPVYCEPPDDLEKGKTNLPPMTVTNVTASGTVSGAQYRPLDNLDNKCFK